MKKTSPLALILVVIIVASPVCNGDDLDPTFGTGGKVTTDFSGRCDGASALALQSDGKIVVAGTSGTGCQPFVGNFVLPHYEFGDFAVARYNHDGSLDATFASGGRVTTDFFGGSDNATAVALQSSGKIVVAGFADNDFALARYNSDGSLDTTLGTGGKVNTDFSGGTDEAWTLAVQSDGKIVVAGWTRVGSSADFALARYNSDGSLDATFGSAGKVTTDFSGGCDGISALGIQSDGKAVVAGRTGTDCGGGAFPTGDFALARYNSDGSLDTTFGNSGRVTTPFWFGWASALTLQPDGKIVAGGTYFGNFGLLRYNSDGSLDTTFGDEGIVTTLIPGYDTECTGAASRAHGLALQPDGKIVAAGFVFNVQTAFALARYNSDGSLDTTFGAGGTVTTSYTDVSDAAFALEVQPDGQIVAVGRACGSFSNCDFALARYNSTNKKRKGQVTSQ